jgi:hypothetical protein
MVKDLGGTYLLTNTDSMYFVASKSGGLIACPGGPHKLSNGTAAVKTITWKQVDEICAKLNRLNPKTTGKVKNNVRSVGPSHNARLPFFSLFLLSTRLWPH